jgi:hypothetical protein
VAGVQGEPVSKLWRRPDWGDAGIVLPPPLTQAEIHARFARGELTAAQAADATMLRRRAGEPPWWVGIVTLLAVGLALLGLAMALYEAHPSVR